MACCLFGADPLPEPMLLYCQLDPKKQISVKLQSKYNGLLVEVSSKCRWSLDRIPYSPEYSCDDTIKHIVNNHTPGGWFIINIRSYQYRNSHHGEETILRPSHLHNGISYAGKTTSLYWIIALFVQITQNFTVSAVGLYGFSSITHHTKYGK